MGKRMCERLNEPLYKRLRRPRRQLKPSIDFGVQDDSGHLMLNVDNFKRLSCGSAFESAAWVPFC